MPQRLAESRIEHLTIGKYYTEPSQAEAFLKCLPSLMQRFDGCDLLLYQPGANPHINDSLGGWHT